MTGAGVGEGGGWVGGSVGLAVRVGLTVWVGAGTVLQAANTKMMRGINAKGFFIIDF